VVLAWVGFIWQRATVKSADIPHPCEENA